MTICRYIRRTGEKIGTNSRWSARYEDAEGKRYEATGSFEAVRRLRT